MTEQLSLKYPIPRCRFGGFAKIYDTYKPALKNRILTNNGRHNAALVPNWNWVVWNYGKVRGRKISAKVAITTHIARIQHIYEYQSL